MTPGPTFFDVEGMSCTARWALVELAPANLHCKVPMGGMLHELHASLCDTVTIVQNHMYSPWDLSKARDLAKDVDSHKDERSVAFSVFGRDIVANCEGNASVKARVDEALPSGHGGVWEGSL